MSPKSEQANVVDARGKTEEAPLPPPTPLRGEVAKDSNSSSSSSSSNSSANSTWGRHRRRRRRLAIQYPVLTLLLFLSVHSVSGRKSNKIQEKKLRKKISGLNGSACRFDGRRHDEKCVLNWRRSIIAEFCRMHVPTINNLAELPEIFLIQTLLKSRKDQLGKSMLKNPKAFFSGIMRTPPCLFNRHAISGTDGEGEGSPMKIASPSLHQNCIGNWRASKVIAAYCIRRVDNETSCRYSGGKNHNGMTMLGK